MKTVEFTNSVDPDEVAHDEPPHQDLQCLLSCLEKKVLMILNFCGRKLCRPLSGAVRIDTRLANNACHSVKMSVILNYFNSTANVNTLDIIT